MSYGHFPPVERGVVSKKYVDRSIDLASYSMNDIFEYFGAERIEAHLRKLKLQKITKNNGESI